MAIYQPADLDFGNEKFSVLLYGAPGVGKSTLAASAPKPILIDLDNGIRRVKAQHRPATSRVSTYEELLVDLKSSAMSEYETIIIDTGGALVTLLQDYVMCQDPVNRTKSGTISLKGFGAVKAEFKRFTDWLKTTLNKNIVYVFHAVEEKGNDDKTVQRLMCEGAARNIVWMPIDFGCFLYKNGKTTVAGFSPTDEYFAKGCYGVSGVMEIPFGDGIINNFLTRLFEQANKTLVADREYFKQERMKYDAVMVEGRKLIEEVRTPTDALRVGNEIKTLAHCLTSLAELRQIFKDKLKEFGFVWDGAGKRYKCVGAEKPETAPDKAEKPELEQETEKQLVEAEKPDVATEGGGE